MMPRATPANHQGADIDVGFERKTWRSGARESQRKLPCVYILLSVISPELDHAGNAVIDFSQGLHQNAGERNQENAGGLEARAQHQGGDRMCAVR
jgi:hypothetical protein